MINLFPKRTRGYYIVTPSYNYCSSGVRTLHLLCHALNEAGQVAQLAAIGTPFLINHNLNTPLAMGGEFIDPIVVYPDIVPGNALGAKHVVRYFLSKRGDYGNHAEVADTDQVWGCLPSVAENVLRIPVSDTSVFYPPQQEASRQGSCFYSHKYDRICGNKLLPITDGMTRLEGSLEQLADILRKSERCYVYELTSAMTEAALCDCPVTLIRTPFFNTIDPECMMGDVQWDDGEVVKVCSDYLPEYQAIVDDVPRQIANFIEKTQAMI